MVLLLYFLNGLHHGLGTDHLMAVTTLARRGASPGEVTRLGLRFGLGHMSVLLLLGSLALLWNFTVPLVWESRAERLGGGLLILLGLWTLLEWLRDAGYIHSHQHQHALRDVAHTHFHMHLGGEHPHRHVHAHFSTVLGALFALSGLRSLLLSVLPILQTRSLAWALIYILFFGVGIVVAMSAYGWAAGLALRGWGQRHWITLAVGTLSLGLGVYWIAAS